MPTVIIIMTVPSALISGLIELPGRPFRLARYYVLVTAAIMLGTIDRLRDGPPAAWEKPEGTR